MNAPRRHHYLPQFYLERFCRDGGLWLFDRGKGEFRRQTPINTAVRRDFYTIPQVDGTRFTEIEKILSVVEGAAKPVIEYLECGEAIDFGQKTNLAMFAALMQVRTPEFRAKSNAIAEAVARSMAQDAFGTEESAAELMARYAAETGRQLEATPAEMSQFYNMNDFEFTCDESAPLGIMLETSVDVAKCIAVMNWRILHAPASTSFVTTDSPFVVIAPSGNSRLVGENAGVLTPGAIKLLPLTDSLCLMAGGPGDRVEHMKAGRDFVRRTNLAVASASYNLILGRDRALVHSLVDRLQLDLRE